MVFYYGQYDCCNNLYGHCTKNVHYPIVLTVITLFFLPTNFSCVYDYPDRPITLQSLILKVF